MTPFEAIAQEQERRYQNGVNVYECHLNLQPEYSLEEYRQLLDETKAKLDSLKLKLKDSQPSPKADPLNLGYQDGLNGKKPKFPHFRNYRKQWEKGFKEYMENGSFWQEQEDSLNVPF